MPSHVAGTILVKVVPKSAEVLNKFSKIAENLSDLKEDLPWKSDLIDEMIADFKFCLQNLQLVRYK